MTDETQTLDQTLDQTLNKTDFGHMINENKKPILIAGAVLVVAIIAYSFYSNQSKKAYQKSLTESYTFEKEVVIPFNEGKIKSDEFLSKMKELPSHVKGTSALVPSILQATDKLIEGGKSTEAMSLLESWQVNFSKSSYMFFFIGLKLAPLYEDANNHDKVISTLESLIASKIDIVKGKLYLDLGRIYLKKGNKEKAKENFKYVLEKYADSDAAKLSKTYLDNNL